MNQSKAINNPDRVALSSRRRRAAQRRLGLRRNVPSVNRRLIRSVRGATLTRQLASTRVRLSGSEFQPGGPLSVISFERDIEGNIIEVAVPDVTVRRRKKRVERRKLPQVETITTVVPDEPSTVLDRSLSETILDRSLVTTVLDRSSDEIDVGVVGGGGVDSGISSEESEDFFDPFGATRSYVNFLMMQRDPNYRSESELSKYFEAFIQFIKNGFSVVENGILGQIALDVLNRSEEDDEEIITNDEFRAYTYVSSSVANAGLYFTRIKEYVTINDDPRGELVNLINDSKSYLADKVPAIRGPPPLIDYKFPLAKAMWVIFNDMIKDHGLDGHPLSDLNIRFNFELVYNRLFDASGNRLTKNWFMKLKAPLISFTDWLKDRPLLRKFMVLENDLTTTMFWNVLQKFKGPNSPFGVLNDIMDAMEVVAKENFLAMLSIITQIITFSFFVRSMMSKTKQYLDKSISDGSDVWNVIDLFRDNRQAELQTVIMNSFIIEKWNIRTSRSTPVSIDTTLQLQQKFNRSDFIINQGGFPNFNLGCFRPRCVPGRLKRYVWIPTNKNNNCFLWCIKRGLCSNDVENDAWSNLIRTRLNITGDLRLTLEEMRRVAIYLNISIHLYYPCGASGESSRKHLKAKFPFLSSSHKLIENIGGFILQDRVLNPNSRTVAKEIHIAQFDSHACLLNGYGKNLPLLDMLRCNTCNRWLKVCDWLTYSKHFLNCYKCGCGTVTTTNGNHTINCRGLVAGRRDLISNAGLESREMKKHFRDKKSSGWDKNAYFADFETFRDKNGHYVVYAAAIVALNSHIPSVFYGPKALNSFTLHCLKLKNPVIWFYNGSSFDNYFFLKELVRLDATFTSKSLVKMSGSSKIYQMKIGTKNNIMHVKDLYLFLYGSLDACCKAFGLPDEYSKSSMNHELISSWDSAWFYRDTVQPYLKLDVIALMEVYKRYASSVHIKYDLNVAKFTTKASLAMGVFTSSLNRKLLYVCNHVLDEEVVRKAYFGGRTDPQSPRYESADYEWVLALLESRDEKRLTSNEMKLVTEFAQYLDVNSLYPSVMYHQKIPIGAPSFIDFDESMELNSLNCCCDKEKWFRRIALVSVTCPKNIITPYLFDRDSKGKLIKNLQTKEEKWYCCVDLYEACSLGYIITKIFKILEWSGSKIIFKEFIGNEWETKKAAIPGTVNYMIPKLMMNSLSGKFAQRDDGLSVQLLTVSNLNDGILPDGNFIRGFELLSGGEIIDEDGKVRDDLIGVFVEQFREPKWSTYPVYISCFILAHSRALMSQYLSKADGYRNIDNAFLYTDTDSYIFPPHIGKILEDKDCLGSGLGKLDDELEGGKILKAIFLAPKTYQLTCLNSNGELQVITKCKGIPHTSKPLDAFNDYYVSDRKELDKVKEIICWLNDESDVQPSINFKKPYYLITDLESNKCYATTCLGLDVFDGILYGDLKVVSVYGSMLKRFGPNKFEGKDFLNIDPIYRTRQINVTDWWKKTERILHERKDGYLMSVPALFDLS